MRLAAEKSSTRVAALLRLSPRCRATVPPLTSIPSVPGARVSKTFLYDPKHSDLATQIRSLRQVTPQSSANKPAGAKKSDSAKDAQIARFKERVRTLEEQVRSLKEENELLYGKLTIGRMRT